MDDRTKVRLVFWLHMAVGTMSYVAVALMIAGAANLLFSSEGVSFWTRGLLYGLLFFSSMYAVNHVGNNDGFCILTDLENFYRAKASMPKVGRFMPRYTASIKALFRRRK